MSLVGFAAKNHPLQRRRGRGDDTLDDRRTPASLFDPLHERWGFTLDAAASAENALLPRFCTVEDSGLRRPWSAERVWVNPPYSDLEPWLRKAWSAMGREKAEMVVMLLPANRTEQGWWQEHVEPWRDGPHRGGNVLLDVRFLSGRIRFDRPGWTPGPKGNRPPFGCVLLTWRREA